MSSSAATETKAEVEQKARAAELAGKQKEIDAINAKRQGKGTRLRCGMTRGKNPQIIVWEAYDESQPKTLPVDLGEFMTLAGIEKEEAIMALLIRGANDASQEAASDPVAEYVNPTWDETTAKRFRVTVKNYAADAGVSVEDAAALIRPGIERKHQADLAAKLELATA